MVDLLTLAGGLVLLLLGGYVLVRSASDLAASFGVSPIVIGLTVVAFGTSAPELAVNCLAAVRDQSALSFGNVIGSNLANLGLILGVSALLRPLDIEGRIVAREIPLMLLATAAALVLGLDANLRPIDGRYERADGAMLLLVFSVFLYTAIGDVVRKRPADPMIVQATETVVVKPSSGRRALNLLLLVLGLVGLYLGGEFTVSGASALARAAGLSETVIGLTVVAVGTSLPEMVTSLIAAQRGQYDIAVGNVIGSNVFNLLLVLGVTSTLAPVEVPRGGFVDLVFLLVMTVLVLPMAATHKRRVVRWEGAVLLAGWLGYTTFRVLTSAPATQG